MNKYEVTLHTFCDACFSQKTCKTSCQRMQTMEKFIAKYEKLGRAFDTACAKVSELERDDTHSKEEWKEKFLNGK